MKKFKALLSISLLLFGSFTHAQQSTQTFHYQGFVFQTYTVPVSGYYLLNAKGGEGGACDNHLGGRGASMSCYYFFNAGEQLRISVAGAGQPVENALQDYPLGAGGGGASSIVLANGSSYLPVLIAGGGGGAGNGIDGDAAQVTQNGTPGRKFDGQIAGSAGVGGGGGGSSSTDGTGGGGAGYSTDGGTCGSSNTIQAWGGQAYLSGNYGGGGHLGGDGGWGGGGEGGQGSWIKNGPTLNSYKDGSGGGGGGYSGGGAGYPVSTPTETNDWGGSGGGGGSFISPLANTNGLVQLPGDNSGNGVVTISGPNTATDVVNTPFNPYIWPANGVSYSAAGTYTFIDSANSIIRTLDLSFGLQSCTAYTRVDTTVVSCGGYTWVGNGRTYTQNMVDSVRIGCTRYIVNLIVAPPVERTIPKGFWTSGVGGLIWSTYVGGPYDPATNKFVVCKNTTATYSIPPVAYASAYVWNLPAGATGASTTNSITISFGNSFNGGNISVTPMNACGAGNTLSANIALVKNPPAGQLNISGPTARVSGTYSVTPLTGATTYTWSVSNNQAVIVSGQGTSSIQLLALPGFDRAQLSVRASNCKGNGSRGNVQLRANGQSLGYIFGRLNNTSDLEAYPNPGNGKFTLSTPPLEIDATLEIYSIEGQLVFSQTIPAYTTTSDIDLHQPSAGIYLARLIAGGEVITLKLVVQ